MNKQKLKNNIIEIAEDIKITEDMIKNIKYDKQDKKFLYLRLRYLKSNLDYFMNQMIQDILFNNIVPACKRNIGEKTLSKMSLILKSRLDFSFIYNAYIIKSPYNSKALHIVLSLDFSNNIEGLNNYEMFIPNCLENNRFIFNKEWIISKPKYYEDIESHIERVLENYKKLNDYLKKCEDVIDDLRDEPIERPYLKCEGKYDYLLFS